MDHSSILVVFTRIDDHDSLEGSKSEILEFLEYLNELEKTYLLLHLDIEQFVQFFQSFAL